MTTLGDRGRRRRCCASSQQLSDSGLGLEFEAFPLSGSAKGTGSSYREKLKVSQPLVVVLSRCESLGDQSHAKGRRARQLRRIKSSKKAPQRQCLGYLNG